VRPRARRTGDHAEQLGGADQEQQWAADQAKIGTIFGASPALTPR